jgi:hypothetical protein
MSAANIEMLERAALALGALIDEVVFVGGATVGLWATDQATAEFRPTDDVDVIVEVTSRSAYYRFEERLRALGFVNDDEDGVICRFRHQGQGLILDVMPTTRASSASKIAGRTRPFRTRPQWRSPRAKKSGRCRPPTYWRRSSRRSAPVARAISCGVAISRT